MKAAWFAVALCSFAFGADADFNGKWNIQVDSGRGRVWWLEVSGAGTPTPAVSFVGAPGGQVDKITDVQIQGGELKFVFQRDKVVQTYKARLNQGKLAGTREMVSDGQTQPVLPWTGFRAPKITEKDDQGWKRGKPVALFNGKDTAGWHLLLAGRPGWQVKDGNLVNLPGASDIVSDAKFWNFVAKAEFRYGKGSNSGIALRGRYEIQIYDNFGKPPDVHGTGALYSRIPPSVNASKAPGEWQAMEIRLVGMTVTVKLNGVTVVDHGHIEGPTAMTMDLNEDQPGPIVLQGDHGIVEYRKLEITPLTR
ncbi:MAG: DUF1080 domain-containing protein [Bryobacterales bacterium]|nr:DUF1080 domain-containing protein [Bryobacterales bacterium]